MFTWAEADLADARARGKRWRFVYMHHPPYTRGTHDSTAEPDLIALHDHLVPLFSAQGVDLVMTGHSHVYERSFLVKDDAVLQPDPSDYAKIGSPDGTIYLVSGCGGRPAPARLDHPLMARSPGNVAGFSLIDVSWSEVRGRFVQSDGSTTDPLHAAQGERHSERPHGGDRGARGAAEVALVSRRARAGGDESAASAENLANYGLDGSGGDRRATPRRRPEHAGASPPRR
jgi:hypothetical protein